ncbi:gluconate 2-dehydrogenase subunit 3 family protein [Pseudogemmatithrix spongiicola]|uniref:Gluconate 2-dehydrogenase subunit 3 family protein n=1 Tax=Pseudogemmatithrix spongiicola TaxID=3062599 RepID=A0AA49K1N2_9BACT|nr:gluconate 2-dehydrogenase subunit 3 family protein [Gemmatimonadaceae bacterium 'strain 138']WKW16051.1 gluconate 2-dehydrogenase subunit 3 family protein [Gemmatimonadaceae bacterium 'strain 318']
MSEMNRRDMLASIAAGAAALSIPREGLEAAAAHAHEAVAAEEQAQQQGQQPAAYVPKQFTADEYRLVRLLVDYVIPRDARSGSATQAGVPQFMDFILGEYPGNRTWMKDGIAWVNAECRRRFGQGFISCNDAQRRELLDAIAYPRRAREQDRPVVEFFNRFRNLTSSGFWTSRMGIADLGYIGNRPVMEWVGTPPNVLAWLERSKPS